MDSGTSVLAHTVMYVTVIFALICNDHLNLIHQYDIRVTMVMVVTVLE